MGESLVPCGTAGCTGWWGQAGAVLSPSPWGLGWHQAVSAIRQAHNPLPLPAEGVTGLAGASIHLCLMEMRTSGCLRRGMNE